MYIYIYMWRDDFVTFAPAPRARARTSAFSPTSLPLSLSLALSLGLSVPFSWPEVRVPSYPGTAFSKNWSRGRAPPLPGGLIGVSVDWSSTCSESSVDVLRMYPKSLTGLLREVNLNSHCTQINSWVTPRDFEGSLEDSLEWSLGDFL